MGIINPIDAVIIDTSAFHQEQFDFIGMQNPIIPAFINMLNKKRIKILSHPVLRQEIEIHIAESEIINRLTNFKTALRKYKDILPIINLSTDDITKSIDKLDLEAELKRAFIAAFKTAEELPYPDVEDVFAQYFAGQPPFSSAGNKKSEFPDAFIILALKEYIKSHPSKCVLVVTNDSDWKKAFEDIPRVILANSIGDGMRLLQNCDDLLPIFREAQPDIERYACSLLTNEAFSLMGYETIDDPEVTEIGIKSINDLFIPLKITNSSILLRTTVELEIAGNATVFDEDRSIWNSEERKYIFAAYSDVVFEKALAEVECDIEIAFNPEDYRDYIEVTSVRLNVPFSIDIALDEHTSTFSDHKLDATSDMMDAMENYFHH